MAREFDLTKKLSKSDIKYLRTRYSDQVVDRMIELAGTVDGDAPSSASPVPGVGSTGDTPETGGEDLIGSSYDPLQHTVGEVEEYVKSVDDDEKARIVAVEQARTDREPRAGVLALA